MMTHWSLQRKLYFCLAALVTLLVLSQANAVHQSRDLFARLEDSGGETAERIRLATNLKLLALRLNSRQLETEVAAFHHDDALDASTGRAVTAELAELEQTLDSMERSAQVVTHAADLAAARQIIELCQRARADLPVWREARSAAREHARAGRMEQAEQARQQTAQPVLDRMVAGFDRMLRLQTDMLHSDVADGAAQYQRMLWTNGGLAAFSAVAVIVAVWVMVAGVRRLRTAAAALAEGSAQVSSAASQISTAAQELARAASEQAASLEETSASTQQIQASARGNQEQSREAAKATEHASRQVDKANADLGQMVHSMSAIVASSTAIAKIIKVIDEIAFRTNMLALNAAVEAARAGEAGMGFAVVADEVRNLAQRSAQAAKDTTALIEEAVANATDGRSKLDQVTATVAGMSNIAGTMERLSQGVNRSSTEQGRGLEQIAAAMTQMDQVTQRLAANAEESAAAGEELSAQTGALDRAVRELEVLVHGRTARLRAA